MNQFVKISEELPIGWVPIAEQLVSVTTTPTVIAGTTGTKYRRFLFVVVNTGGPTGLVQAELCRPGETLATASKIPPTGSNPATVLGPFDAVGMPYALRAASATGCIVSVMASSLGEPEQLIAGA